MINREEKKDEEEPITGQLGTNLNHEQLTKIHDLSID